MKARRRLEGIKITVEGHEVLNTQSERLLGLTVDSNLTWTPHIRGEVWRPKGENEPGWLSHLTTRATAVRRLIWAMSTSQLRAYIEGTINAIIQYKDCKTKNMQ